eukprot:6781054-Prymnesium_polylepis.1
MAARARREGSAPARRTVVGHVYERLLDLGREANVEVVEELGELCTRDGARRVLVDVAEGVGDKAVLRQQLVAHRRARRAEHGRRHAREDVWVSLAAELALRRVCNPVAARRGLLGVLHIERVVGGEDARKLGEVDLAVAVQVGERRERPQVLVGDGQ